MGEKYMARYSVVYDDLIAKWAVVDTNAAGMVIGFHDHEDVAHNSARNEEEIWPERYGESE
ncbi:MAG: hypothetical protein HN403_19255 [Rhodospirillales bacterium]|jgi:hypothetical protein|nr:hypothetical protein [Rhodospirillales bacterium]